MGRNTGRREEDCHGRIIQATEKNTDEEIEMEWNGTGEGGGGGRSILQSASFVNIRERAKFTSIFDNSIDRRKESRLEKKKN